MLTPGALVDKVHAVLLTGGRAAGEADMPYPPDYPKMPGEPKRVQPSRDRDRPRA